MALSKEQIQQVIGEGIQELLQDGVIPFDLSAVQAIVNKISEPLVDTFEAQSGLSGLPIRTFTEFNPLADVVSNVKNFVSTPLWSGNESTLTSFFTNSNASVDITKTKTLPYYLNVYNKDPNSGTATIASASEAQFAVAYAHRTGGGFTTATGENRKQPTKALYSQYRSLLIGYSDPKFTIGTKEKDHIYIVNINRGRIKERLDPGNWELRLSGSAKSEDGSGDILGSHTILKLIDDSGQGKSAVGTVNNPLAGGGSRQFNIVSGTVAVSDDDATFGVQQGTTNYGLLYPDIGVLVLDPDEISSSISFVHGNIFNSGTADYSTQNLEYLYNAMNGGGSAVNDFDNGGTGFRARSEEEVTSTHYFCRVQNRDYNFSNNPTFFTSSDGSFTNDSFFKDPIVYITTVGLYNDNYELLAVAKLSQPLQKSFAKEAVIKVKLDF